VLHAELVQFDNYKTSSPYETLMGGLWWNGLERVAEIELYRIVSGLPA